MAEHQSNNRPGRIKDITGQRFGMLTVLSMASKKGPRNKSFWECMCDCGTRKVISRNGLVSGSIRSCGCLKVIAGRESGLRMTIHGLSDTWIQRVWSGMIQRCYNPNNTYFPYYGGRGVRICKRWLDSVADFYSDMGDRPSPKHTIDRINNCGDYEPDNCRWASAKEQSNNRRNCRFLEFNGKRQTIGQWTEELGVTWNFIARRLKRGWSVEETLTTPSDRPNRYLHKGPKKKPVREDR